LPYSDNLNIVKFNQAHLWIPEEQKFLIVGGRNPNKTSEILKSAQLFSYYNQQENEEL